MKKMICLSVVLSLLVVLAGCNQPQAKEEKPKIERHKEVQLRTVKSEMIVQ